MDSTASTTADIREPGAGFRPTTGAALVVLALLLITNVPLFVCMPISDDVALYDLQARMWMSGGTLYRDIFEPNLPGVVWIHAGIRSLLGTSTEAIRIADLALLSVFIYLLARWLRAAGRPLAVQVWTAVVVLMCYLSISEWNHCQRDVWLLVPALAAFHLRRLQMARIATEDVSRSQVLLWSLLEGVCWGAGVWIKPMIVLPALACFLTAALLVRRLRYLLPDLGGLLLGGLSVGAAGIGWLWFSGSWPYFLETFLEWNPRYFAAGKQHWTGYRFLGMCFRFFPWILLTLVAVPVAIGYLSTIFRRTADNAHKTSERQATALFSAFYIGWLLQSFFLQHLFDYVHAPGLLLAIGMLAASPPAMRAAPSWRPALIGLLAIALLVSPLWRSDRLACWWTCVSRGATPEVKTRLARLAYPDWQDMDRVAGYLRGLHLQDGELTCFNNDLVHLYLQLGLRPPSRYVYLESLMAYFPDERRLFRDSVVNSEHRYVVTDLTTTRLPRDELLQRGAAADLSLPASFPPALRKTFPWSYPIVFRSGTLLVHRVPRTAVSAPGNAVSGVVDAAQPAAN